MADQSKRQLMDSMSKCLSGSSPDPDDFSPPLLRLQQVAPNPMDRKVLWVLLALLASLLLWAIFGTLDIVAVAEGKLVPQSYLKIVQPAESGIVKEILVKEGEAVRKGQVLMRMDALIAEADVKSIENDYLRKRLALRRIDAELGNRAFLVRADDPPDPAKAAEAQYRANRAALEAALAEERSRLLKARQDMAAAVQVQTKLIEVLPHYRQQEVAFEKLARGGFAGDILLSDKRRERVEKEQELNMQSYVIESARTSIIQSRERLTQIEADYRRQLHAERNEVQGEIARLDQEMAKLNHRKGWLELRASQDGLVKDLATHTTGTVVQPGTVLLTLLPIADALLAEVWLSNEDVGFVHEGQSVQVKLVPYPFQKYGMIEGVVKHVAADSAEHGPSEAQSPTRSVHQSQVYKALVALKATSLKVDTRTLRLAAGMQVNAEILLGTRTVMEYLLSPLQGAWQEAGRER